MGENADRLSGGGGGRKVGTQWTSGSSLSFAVIQLVLFSAPVLTSAISVPESSLEFCWAGPVLP